MEELLNTSSTVITYTDYHQFKSELDEELQKSAESFIKIGYLLKVARDTGILKESGYENVNDFAWKEYGLEKTQVSRFIRINDRFSEDGYSKYLKKEYIGFGYAKLAVMLLLPDGITGELSPAYSKSEIETIKKEYEEEQQITDLEVMMEEKDEVQQSLDSLLTQVAYQIGKDNNKLYCTLWESQMEKNEGVRAFIEHLAPSGNQTYSVRIPGTGKMLLMFKESGDIVLINARDANDKYTYTNQEVLEAFRSIFEIGTAKESWSSTYGEPFPEEKVEVAPVQPVQRKESKVVPAKKSEKKPEPKKEPKKPEPQPEPMTLHDIQEDIPEPSPVPEEPEQEENTENTECEQQLPGQDSIENHPEYMPDPEPTAEELQESAYQTVVNSIATSMSTWKDKKMPLESIRQNIKNTKKVLELLEKLEKLAESEE